MKAAGGWIAAALMTMLGVAPGRGEATRAGSWQPPRVLPREWVGTLASPAFEGRGPGTPGLDSAAVFIARVMESFRLVPAGENGTWYQPMEVTTGVEVAAPCGVAIGGRSWDAGGAFQPLGFSTNGTLTAPVVFAGYGITAPGFDYDDYAGLDVKDKFVLVLSNEPQEMDSTSRFDGSVNTPHADLRTKAINAREHGALGLLVAHGPIHHADEPLRKPRTDGAGYMTSGLLAGAVSQEVAAALFAGSGTELGALQKAIDASLTPHSRALAESVTVTVNLKRTRANIRNVVGMIPGRDSSRTLVIGAHYDHLGYGNEGSLAPDSHLPHVGADDNASGVAAALGVAAAFAGRTPEHHLVFVAFTGEEMGLVGSSHFTDDPPRPLETVEAMLNMDMVGRLRDDRLMVLGRGTAVEFPALLENVNRALGKADGMRPRGGKAARTGGTNGARGAATTTVAGARAAATEAKAGAGTGAFDLRLSDDGFGPSDHSSFYKRNVPVLMLFTGAHADYHKPSDTADKIDYDGLARITRFATALVESLDARPRPTFQKAKAEATMGRIAGGGGYGAWLGTVPDYMQTEGGVLLSGVRAGSPAEAAGLAGGDVIVRFDGVRVDNIYDYTFALRSRKPGQPVRITVKRAGRELDLVATLGRRP